MESSTKNQPDEKPKLELFEDSINYLKEIRRWSKFFAIMGFISVAILVFAGIIMSIVFMFIDYAKVDTPFPLALLGIVYVILGAVYFLPALYLLKFSDKAKKAIFMHDSNVLSESFKSLKSLFRYIGIVTIVLISLYPIFIITIIVISFTGNFPMHNV